MMLVISPVRHEARRQAENRNRLYARYSRLVRQIQACMPKYCAESEEKGRKAFRVLQQAVSLKTKHSPPPPQDWGGRMLPARHADLAGCSA